MPKRPDWSVILCQIQPPKKKKLTRPFQILIKLGKFVHCDPTAEDLKFEANQTNSSRDTVPQCLQFLSKMVVVVVLQPHLSQKLLGQCSQTRCKLERDFNQDSKSAFMPDLSILRPWPWNWPCRSRDLELTFSEIKSPHLLSKIYKSFKMIYIFLFKSNFNY